MPTGPGSEDAQGQWQYGEDDAEALASDLLNYGQSRVSTGFAADRARLTALEAAIYVAASSAARDAHFGTPANATARLALQNAGALCIRTDKGWTEQYFANTTDGGSNPGGVTTAGWYPLAGSIELEFSISSNPSVATTDTTISWAAKVNGPTGAWASSPNPSRIVLGAVALGVWRPRLVSHGTSMDTRLLRSAVTKNGGAISAATPLDDYRAGVSAVVDPYVGAEADIQITSATDYVEAKVNANTSGGSLVAAGTRLILMYRGPIRNP